jgi:hypothetical protein
LLTHQQEKSLVKWINGLSNKGLFVSTSIVRNFAEEIVKKKPGKNWTTRFLIGILSKAKRIFSKRQYEKDEFQQRLQDGNCEWITSIACICADGTSLSPGLVYQATSKQLQNTWFQDFEAEQHSCFFGASPTGWTNNDVGFAWL